MPLAQHNPSVSPSCPSLRAEEPTRARPTPRMPASENLNVLGTLPDEIRTNVETVFAARMFDEAATACIRLLDKHPTSSYLWLTLGLCHKHRRSYDEAMKCLRRAQELAPDTAEPYAAMSEILQEQNHIEEAEATLKTSLAIDPDNLVQRSRFSAFLAGLGRHEEAIAQLEHAKRLSPDNPPLLYNLANALRCTGNHSRALELYTRALELDPEFDGAQYNLAQLLRLEHRYAEAADQFAAILERNPADDRARSFLLHMKAMNGDFSGEVEYQEHRRHIGLLGTTVPPLNIMAHEDNPDLLRVRSQAYANEVFGSRTRSLPNRTRPSMRPPRIKIGYFSADFHSHATMHLIDGLLRHHDSSRFEIHAFSYGQPKGDQYRANADQLVHSFHDVHDLTDHDLIDFARNQKIDIAVDLKGYTGFSRTEIFGSGIAPIQIAYLGYPGTMGTPAFDYFVSDSVVTPEGSERHFSEYLIRLPHCYQPNDNLRTISSREFTRADCGLPEQGFVFCSFNNSYKITSHEFGIWMNLLREADSSILWLLSSSKSHEDNLRNAAQAHGVDPSRLYFAERMPVEEHLARQRVADLFLDSFAVNAHTTASDALWAGLPLITKAGQQFAARVSASLLTSVGLQELITSSDAEYEQLALACATDPDKLLKIRSKLKSNREIAPLFDTAGYTRDLEQAYDVVYERWRQDKPATHVTLSRTPMSPTRSARDALSA